MDWFRRHRPEDAPTVKEAIETRDALFVELDKAIRDVDRVQDRVLTDYQAAEQERLQRGKQRRFASK